ncbi:methyltransferase family protein [Streptomyces sp. Amel2xB2]|uniref:Methyltransferase type 11 n=1 Tax=Streptomyces nanshensis TaxID=518642 RepID=A0A1E7LCL5_9ACTN|nr:MULTISPECIES: class I SAM-dependent methyltransferase [Streptomyces]OEV13904.1 methyltransferase type 11 [Streptomyces nanshensis]RAJ66619.1 methyltransferase family protein [Streptomyces sp. Amel2xB2]
MPLTSQSLPEYWDTYKPHKGEGTPAAPAVDSFEWTQYPGHGPGTGFLGRPRTALELGSAEGREAVHLARTGVEVTALDFSPAQTARARLWWEGTPGLSFVNAEACDYLAETTSTFDAVYSRWGAVWFTDPERLVPLVARRLNPGGVLALSQAEPIDGFYGPQAMYGNGLSGRRLPVLRWAYSPEMWAELLERHRFTGIDASVLPAPEPDNVGTLMVRAKTPGAPGPQRRRRRTAA